MVDILAGFPFWQLRFNEKGQAEDPAALDAFINEVKAQQLSDLFIFSHGWNNDPAMALALYRGFFGEMRKLIDDPALPKRRPATIGTAGLIWPAIKWPDEEAPTSDGGAASLGSEAESDLFVELKKVFKTKKQQRILDELSQLLEQKNRSEEDLKQFKAKLSQLITRSKVRQSSPDTLEGQGVLVNDNDWREVFELLADQEPAEEDMGGAAGLGDEFGRLWQGAKAALRMTTYWQMKDRAGTVGKVGLGPLLGRLHTVVPELRVHLLGHSFGARLVSYALKGMPKPTAGDKSPVKSLFLLQGAFSHFTFADVLPFDQTRKGDLVGMASRVDGPLLTTHSLKDTAVGIAYPLASLVSGQDAADQQDPVSRWGAMGNDGAQAVNAQMVQLAAAGALYTFEAGKWLNLDGNQVIIEGGPPVGAHGDIIHPETAWAALAAAGC